MLTLITWLCACGCVYKPIDIYISLYINLEFIFYLNWQIILIIDIIRTTITYVRHKQRLQSKQLSPKDSKYAEDLWPDFLEALEVVTSGVGSPSSPPPRPPPASSTSAFSTSTLLPPPIFPPSALFSHSSILLFQGVHGDEGQSRSLCIIAYNFFLCAH